MSKIDKIIIIHHGVGGLWRSRRVEQQLSGGGAVSAVVWVMHGTGMDRTLFIPFLPSIPVQDSRIPLPFGLAGLLASRGYIRSFECSIAVVVRSSFRFLLTSHHFFVH